MGSEMCIRDRLRIEHSIGSLLFIGVEKRWNGQGFSVFYPTVYKKEALEYVKHLPFYLVKIYGYGIKRQFSARIKKEIDATKWDDEEKRSYSEEELELKDAQAAHKSMAWFTFDPNIKLGKLEGKPDPLADLSDSQHDDAVMGVPIGHRPSILSNQN